MIKKYSILKISFLSSFLILILQGCATGYQKEGATGGYSHLQLDTDVYKVTFKGNGFTSRQRVSDFALLRSAEITLLNGYNYFIILDIDNYVSRSSYTTPTTSQTNMNFNHYGNSVYGNATTTTYGGQTYNVSKPSYTNTIMCLTEKSDTSFSYNAQFVASKIKEKYGLIEERQKDLQQLDFVPTMFLPARH